MEQQSNKAFEEMLLPAKKRLKDRLPMDIARKSGAVYYPETSLLTIDSLGQTIKIEFPQFECRQQLENWHHLVLLHYLDLADETPVSPQLIPFGELKDGLIRGTKFDHTIETELSQFLTGRQPDEIKKICMALGADFVDSKADLTAVFPFFPFYPITLNIWFADDEFPASGKMLLSKSADHYLTVEDAVTVGEVLLKRLCFY